MRSNEQVLRDLIDEIVGALQEVETRSFLFKDQLDQIPKDPCIVSSGAIWAVKMLQYLTENPQAMMEWRLGLAEDSLKDMSYVDALRLRDGEIQAPVLNGKVWDQVPGKT